VKNCAGNNFTLSFILLTTNNILFIEIYSFYKIFIIMMQAFLLQFILIYLC